jgi:hypothetical protein
MCINSVIEDLISVFKFQVLKEYERRRGPEGVKEMGVPQNQRKRNI